MKKISLATIILLLSAGLTLSTQAQTKAVNIENLTAAIFLRRCRLLNCYAGFIANPENYCTQLNDTRQPVYPKQ